MLFNLKALSRITVQCALHIHTQFIEMSKQQITGGILLHMILTKIETKNTKQFHQNNP